MLRLDIPIVVQLAAEALQTLTITISKSISLQSPTGKLGYELIEEGYAKSPSSNAGTTDFSLWGGFGLSGYGEFLIWGTGLSLLVHRPFKQHLGGEKLSLQYIF